MKYFFILLTSLVIANSASAQSAEDSVKNVVQQMFAAMKNSDGILLKNCFAEQVIFQTIIKDKNGNTMVKTEDATAFVEQVGKAEPQSLDERIQFETVKVDGDLAIVWTPYRFYYKEKFSHCGVNSFQLVRIGGDWKIQYIIDTRRKTNCKE